MYVVCMLPAIYRSKGFDPSFSWRGGSIFAVSENHACNEHSLWKAAVVSSCLCRKGSKRFDRIDKPRTPCCHRRWYIRFSWWLSLVCGMGNRWVRGLPQGRLRALYGRRKERWMGCSGIQLRLALLTSPNLRIFVVNSQRYGHLQTVYFLRTITLWVAGIWEDFVKLKD